MFHALPWASPWCDRVSYYDCILVWGYFINFAMRHDIAMERRSEIVTPTECSRFAQINSLEFHCSISIVRKSGNCRINAHTYSRIHNSYFEHIKLITHVSDEEQGPPSALIRARDKTIWYLDWGTEEAAVTSQPGTTSKPTKSARIHFISEHVPMISEHLWVSL